MKGKEFEYLISLLIVLIPLAGCNSAAEEETDIVTPTRTQTEWAEAEIGVLIHLDMPVFKPEYNWRVWGTHPDPSVFNPVDLDTDQWMETAAKLGARYAVLVAKHGSGFSLWPTNAHDYSVKNSSWRNGEGDIVKDFVESCKKYGLKPGIYASTTANGYLYVDNPGLVQEGSPVTQEEYNTIVNTQLTELWSNYGELFEIWFDGGVLGKDRGGADVLSLLKKLQPNAVAFQGPYGYENLVRWVGNEEGVAPYPCWATADSTTNSDGTVVVDGLHGNPFAPYWCPGEADFTLRWNRSFQGGWFWTAGEDHMMFTLEELMKKYETSVGRNTNMLLGLVIDDRGLIPEADVKRVEELGNEIKRQYGQPLQTMSGKGKTFTLKPDSPVVVDRVVIQEDIFYGERVLEYELSGKLNGQWTVLATGTNIGHKHIVRFAPREVEEIKLNIKLSKAEPVIRNFSIYTIK